MKFSTTFFLLMVTLALVRAEDWTLTDGTVYHGVKVLSHDSAFVTIMDSDGGSKVPLRLLPADLQAKFGYDAKAAAAAEQAAIDKDHGERRAVLQSEQQAAAQVAQPAPPPPAPAAHPVAQSKPSPAPGMPALGDLKMQVSLLEIKISDAELAAASAKTDFEVLDREARKSGYNPAAEKYEQGRTRMKEAAEKLEALKKERDKLIAEITAREDGTAPGVKLSLGDIKMRVGELEIEIQDAQLAADNADGDLKRENRVRPPGGYEDLKKEDRYNDIKAAAKAAEDKLDSLTKERDKLKAEIVAQEGH